MALGTLTITKIPNVGNNTIGSIEVTAVNAYTVLLRSFKCVDAKINQLKRIIQFSLNDAREFKLNKLIHAYVMVEPRYSKIWLPTITRTNIDFAANQSQCK